MRIGPDVAVPSVQNSGFQDVEGISNVIIAALQACAPLIPVFQTSTLLSQLTGTTGIAALEHLRQTSELEIFLPDLLAMQYALALLAAVNVGAC